jgi:putative hydrolase of the HAD superfamily
VTRWLVCDYGNVLSLPQPAADLERLAGLSGLDTGELTRRYWADREAYDRADLDAAHYWARVTPDDRSGTRGPIDGERLRALIEADIASWTHLNPDTVAATARAARRGYRLALLSNAPIEIARAVEQLPELADFHPRWFSCDLRATKPDPAVYAGVLARLAETGDPVTFIDDRPANVAAAIRAGLHSVLFENPSQIDDL